MTMSSERIRPIFSVTLLILDAMMVTLAFFLAYRLRALIPWPAELGQRDTAFSLCWIDVGPNLWGTVALAFYRQYYLPRAVSRVDQFYACSPAYQSAR